MPQINRKSSLGHWYAPVFAPDFPRDPPEIHGCTLFERCNGCPYPGHGFICWQSEDTCLRTRMNKINGLESCKQKSIAEMKKVPQNLRS